MPGTIKFWRIARDTVNQYGIDRQEDEDEAMKLFLERIENHRKITQRYACKLLNSRYPGVLL